MPCCPHSLTPSTSYFSYTFTSTHTQHQHRVTPLLKNYTEHLPFIVKTHKQVVFNQVSSFLPQNNRLDDKQSGFKSGHLNETALMSVTESLRIVKVRIYLDLTAAFDTVNHQIPLSTLSSLGNTETLLFTGLNPVPHRSFRVAKRGVPSGSFLKDQFLDPFSSPYTLQHWGLPYRHMNSPNFPILMTHSFIFIFFISMRWSKDCCMDPRLPGRRSRHGWKNITSSST